MGLGRIPAAPGLWSPMDCESPAHIDINTLEYDAVDGSDGRGRVG